MILSRSGLALALLGLSTSYASAQDRPSLDKAIPASSYFATTYAGWDACAQAWKNLSIAPMVNDLLTELMDEEMVAEQMAEFRGQVLPELRRQIQDLGVDLGTVRALLSAPNAMVVGRPTISGGIPIPSMAFLFSLERQDQKTFPKLLSTLRSHLPLDSEKVGSRTVHRFVLGEIPGFAGVWIGMEDHLVVATNSPGLLTDVFETAKGTRPRAQDRGAFGAGRKGIGGKTLANFWINTEPLMAALEPMLPYEASDLAAALGLGEMTGIYGAATAVGNSSEETLHIGWKGAMQGLFRAPFAGPSKLDVAAWCSPETVAYGSMHFDPSQAMGDVVKLMGKLPAWMHREMSRELEYELGAGLHEIGSQLQHFAKQARLFTGDMAFSCATPKNLPLPEVTLYLGVRDAEVATRELRGLMQMVDSENVKETYRQQKFLQTAIHSIQVKIEQVGVAPCFCVKDGVLMVSSHPRILKATLRRVQKSKPSLADDPAFVAAKERARGASVFGYLAAGRLAEALLGSRQLMQMMAQQGDFDAEMIPEGEVLREALGSLSLTGHLDANGFTWKTRSPMGYGGLLAGHAMAMRWIESQVLGNPSGQAGNGNKPQKKKIY